MSTRIETIINSSVNISKLRVRVRLLDDVLQERDKITRDNKSKHTVIAPQNDEAIKELEMKLNVQKNCRKVVRLTDAADMHEDAKRKNHNHNSRREHVERAGKKHPGKITE
jgi:hypothetical protein